MPNLCFRQGRSTDDAVHFCTDFVAQKLDSEYKCLTIFLDLKKALDTVSLSKLRSKLETLGIRDAQLSLFTSFLTSRKQQVRIGDNLSEERSLDVGVPQGSVLGFSLFLCYINDFCQMKLQHCNIISYAGDTTLTFYGKS